jgi:protein involved in polysaccharide export with SLBB domain
VTEFASKFVYVMGQVTQPGKYTFETIPNMWQVILEAGGPTPTAKLTQVTILRGAFGPEAGKITSVDLTRALKSGDLTQLPPIYPGDTIQIPAIGEKAVGAGFEKDVVYIFGGVATQGAVPYLPEADLLETIVMAGGPTPEARLDEVRVISRSLGSGTVVQVDLNKYTSNANPLPISLQPGDVVYVPTRGGPPAIARVASRVLLRILTSGITSFLIFRVFR